MVVKLSAGKTPEAISLLTAILELIAALWVFESPASISLTHPLVITFFVVSSALGYWYLRTDRMHALTILFVALLGSLLFLKEAFPAELKVIVYFDTNQNGVRDEEERPVKGKSISFFDKYNRFVNKSTTKEGIAKFVTPRSGPSSIVVEGAASISVDVGFLKKNEVFVGILPD